jgi:hypothetical protein
VYRRFITFSLMLLLFIIATTAQAQEPSVIEVKEKSQAINAIAQNEKKSLEAATTKNDSIESVTLGQVAADEASATPVTVPTSFAKQINWTVILDAYYGYNFNRPDDNVNAGFYMEPRHNRPTLNMVKLNLEKQATLESPFGFRVDLVGGPSNQLLLGVKDRARGLDATRFLWQGYVSYAAPIGKGLTIDFGKFATPVGAEVVDTKDNFNYSHSYLFAYGPFYHTGLRAKYAFTDQVSVTGYLVNAWDSIGDTNSGKTFGFTVSITPHKKFGISIPSPPLCRQRSGHLWVILCTAMIARRWGHVGIGPALQAMRSMLSINALPSPDAMMCFVMKMRCSRDWGKHCMD